MWCAAHLAAVTVLVIAVAVAGSAATMLAPTWTHVTVGRADLAAAVDAVRVVFRVLMRAPVM
jgi:hypothetical protein